MQTLACLEAVAVEKPVASVVTEAGAAPALECVCGAMMAVHGGSFPEGWG